MHLVQSIALLASFTPVFLRLAAAECNREPSEQPDYCVSQPPANDSLDIPRSWGYIIYQAFEPLDVFGPIDVISYLANQYKLDLHLISETMNPVTSRPALAAMNPMNSSSYVEILPTTTVANAPELDVLVIPGGIGSRSPNLNKTISFIKERYPKVKYLVSVCTGALLVSKSGVLDGKHATTNKRSYKSITATNDKVLWQPEARWVTDGNLWTTSGVSSGIDGMLAFIRCLYGDEVMTTIVNNMEYERHVDAHYDPFADIWNTTSS